MAFHTPGIHRTLASAIGVAALVATAPTAAADPPNCTAADLAGVAGGVTVATSACLFTHPEVNGFFTGLKGLTKDEMSNRVADASGRRVATTARRAPCTADRAARRRRSGPGRPHVRPR